MIAQMGAPHPLLAASRIPHRDAARGRGRMSELEATLDLGNLSDLGPSGEKRGTMSLRPAG